tara:strand:- start:5771 stop:6133 length:363 start_codon:yes stop_codon:yes gene_type:complete
MKSSRGYIEYLRASYNIAEFILEAQIKDNGGTNLFCMDSLSSITSGIINKVTSAVNKSTYLEDLKNIYREELLNLGIEGDFIPNEELIEKCCRETFLLIEKTIQLNKKQDENNDDYPSKN